MFDLSISLGNLLTVGAFIIGGIAFAYSIKSDTKIFQMRFSMIDTQMEDFKDEIKKLVEIVIEQTRQSGRIDRVEERQLQEGKRVDRLEERMSSR
jgi:hypothetical protein